MTLESETGGTEERREPRRCPLEARMCGILIELHGGFVRASRRCEGRA